MTIQEAADLLRRQDQILLLTHRRPDGDTIGCAAGLCAALRQLGKAAYILPNPDVTETNRIYADPYWAPADFSPGFVVSVDVAARQLFFQRRTPGLTASIWRWTTTPPLRALAGPAVWTPAGRPAGRSSMRSAGNWDR